MLLFIFYLPISFNVDSSGSLIGICAERAMKPTIAYKPNPVTWAFGAQIIKALLG